MNISAKTIVENYVSQYRAADDTRRSSFLAAYEKFKRQYAEGLNSGNAIDQQKEAAIEEANSAFAQAGQALNEKITKSIKDFKNAFIKAYNGAEPDSQRIANCVTFLRAEGENITVEQVNAIISDSGCTENMDTLRRLRRIVELQQLTPMNGTAPSKAKSAKCFKKLNLYDGVIAEIDKLAELASRLFTSKSAVSNEAVFVAHNSERADYDSIVPNRGRELYVPMITLSELIYEGNAVELAAAIDKLVMEFEAVTE